jgi:RNA polymerase sigma-70 factor (sigma-E family)
VACYVYGLLQARISRRCSADADCSTIAGQLRAGMATDMKGVADNEKALLGTVPQDPRRTAAARPFVSAGSMPDRDVVRDLYQAHGLTLVRLAKLLLGDQPSAEDAVQDAFLGLYRALPRLTDHDEMLPYLRAAVINASRSVLRARRRALRRPVQHEPAGSSAESAAMAGEDRRAVQAAVARLPRRGREVLVLRYYLDLQDQEIAVALGISRGTVSSTASRALAVMARELREEL